MLDEPVNDALIPVVTTELVVTGSCTHLNGGEAVIILADFQQGHVERATAKVEDQNQFIFLTFFQAIRQSCCGWLVDDALNVQSGDLAGFLRGLTLRIREVCGDGDDRIGHRFTEVFFRVMLEFAEDTRGDFLRGVILIVDGHFPVGAHVALD